MDKWLEQTETLNVIGNENGGKRRSHRFKIIKKKKKNGVRTEFLSCVVCIYL